MEVGLSVVTAFAFDSPIASAGLGVTPSGTDVEFAFADALPWYEPPDNSNAEKPAASHRQKGAQTLPELLREPTSTLSAWLGMLPVSSPPLLIPVEPVPPPQVGLQTDAQAGGDQPDALSAACPAVETDQAEAYQAETFQSETPEPTFQFELDAPAPSRQDTAAEGGISNQPSATPGLEETQPRLTHHELAPPPAPEPLAVMTPIPAAPTLLSPVPVEGAVPSVPVSGPNKPSLPNVTASRLTDSRGAENRVGAPAPGPQSATPPITGATASPTESSGQRLLNAFTAPGETHRDVFRLVVQDNPANEAQSAPPLDEPPLTARPLTPTVLSDEGIARNEVPVSRETQERAARSEDGMTALSMDLWPIWVPSVDQTERPIALAGQSSSTEIVDTVNLPEPVGHPEEAPAAAALNELTLTPADGERVSLHLQQSSRGLEVRVAAADEASRQQLRAGLDELIDRVEKQGLGSLMSSPANTGAADDREAGGRHRQPPEQEWEPRRSRRTRTTLAEGSPAFTALLGLGNTGRKD